MRVILISLVLAFSQPSWAQQQETADSSPASLHLTVTAADNKPIQGANVEIRKWWGGWEAIGLSAQTDEKGQVKFDEIPTEDYLTAVVRRDGFAPVMLDMQLTEGETREVTCILSVPVSSFLTIMTLEGRPLAGAEMMRLEVSDPHLGKYIITQDMLEMLGAERSRSDEQGRLALPLLPIGSKVTVSIVHPRNAPAIEHKLQVKSGELAKIKLAEGCHTTFKFVPSPDISESLDTKEVLFKSSKGRDDPENGVRVIHPFKIKDSEISIGFSKRDYETFRARIPGYVTTPSFASDGTSPKELDFSSKHKSIEFLVRPLVKVKGRVVTSDGKPIDGISISGYTQNLYPPDADGKLTTPEGRPWSGGSVIPTESSSDGSFEIKMPPGKSQLSIYSNDYFVVADSIEFEVEFGDSSAAPDIVVQPMPVVTGVATDPQGKVIPHAVFRAMDRSEASYSTADEAGRFSYRIRRFIYDRSSGKRTLVMPCLVFDPNSSLATKIDLELADPTTYQDLNLVLEARDDDWMFNVILGEIDEEYLTKFDQSVEEARKKFPGGLPGESVNNMATGTWLNTHATSLDDFHGKYVFLDFWFIGCGPCIRDMPTVKLAQELFGEKNFTVVSIHLNAQTPENVQQFADAKGMGYPIVVDDADGSIVESFKPAGVTGFPSYILLGPDGKIIHNARAGDFPSLRIHKLEVIRSFLVRTKDKP